MADYIPSLKQIEALPAHAEAEQPLPVGPLREIQNSLVRALSRIAPDEAAKLPIPVQWDDIVDLAREAASRVKAERAEAQLAVATLRPMEIAALDEDAAIDRDDEAPRTVGRLPPLVRVRDLEQFDGALVSEFHVACCPEERFLGKWCAFTAGARSRWLVVPTSVLAIEDYLTGKTALRALFNTRTRFMRTGFVVECEGVEGTLFAENATPVALDRLPSGFLPSWEIFHDPTLRPKDE